MHLHRQNIFTMGFQQRGPLLCKGLGELENLRTACDPYRCQREVENKALRVGLGVGNEASSTLRLRRGAFSSGLLLARFDESRNKVRYGPECRATVRLAKVPSP